MKINGETRYIWRADDREGAVLESCITNSRNRRAALAFLKKAMKRYGPPKVDPPPDLVPTVMSEFARCLASGDQPVALQLRRFDWHGLAGWFVVPVACSRAHYAA